MTRPGTPSSRGRHAAPDEGARAAGRHAAAEETEPRRHSAPDVGRYSAEPARRRHGAREDDPPARTGPVNGHQVDQPVIRFPLEEPARYYGAAEPLDGYRAEDPVNGYRAEDPVNGYGAEGPFNGYRVEGPVSRFPLDEPRHDYRPEGPVDYRPEGPVDYRSEGPVDYRTEGPVDGYRVEEPGGRFPIEGPVNGHAVDGPVSGFPYRRPEPVDRYRLDEPPAPPPTGYRLGESAPPVTGFPYTALPPDAPTAWPVNGHGVDRAERDAAAWPVNGHATQLPPAVNGVGGTNGVNGRGPVNGHAPAPFTGWQREPLRPAYPPILPREEPAGPALDDESTQQLRRYVPAAETLEREAGEPQLEPAAPHPPRAVIRRRRARRRALEWPVLIVFALLSAYFIRAYVVQTFYIPSGSMHETLLEGDRVLVNKVSYHLHDVHRGDVVVFRRPPDFPVDDDDLIKRVVAVPGETVEAHGGKVYVDGAPLTEPYVEPACRGTSDFPQVTVPPGKLWVMGDNRCNSSDSRVFGPIDEKLVVGRAFVLAWPVGRLSWL